MFVNVLDGKCMSKYHAFCKFRMLFAEVVAHSVYTADAPVVRVITICAFFFVTPVGCDNVSDTFELCLRGKRVSRGEAVELSGFHCDQCIGCTHINGFIAAIWHCRDTKFFCPAAPLWALPRFTTNSQFCTFQIACIFNVIADN